MSNEREPSSLPDLGLEPENLDGHTIEELSDYLAAGRTPIDPAIESSPGCRLALDALERLNGLAPRLLAADIAAEPGPDESWVQRILTGITLDSRAGRRIPMESASPRADLGITEGAVRGLIRAAEHAVPGVVVGRCHLDGDVTEPGALIRIRAEVSVPYGDPIAGLVDRLRDEIADRLRTHTDLHVSGIDITVHDVQKLPPPK